jgi:anti-anti-sigma factor
MLLLSRAVGVIYRSLATDKGIGQMTGGIRTQIEFDGGGDATVFVRGEIDLATGPELERVLTELVDRGARRLVIDLSAVDLLAIAGLRVFDVIGQRLVFADGRLRLSHPRPSVARILRQCITLFGLTWWDVDWSELSSEEVVALGLPANARARAIPGVDRVLAAAVQAPERVAAVRQLAQRYSPPSRIFGRLTRLAAGLLSTPVALLTLVDEDRQFFVSSWGLPEPFRSARQTALEYSICQYVVATGRPLILNDTSRDPRMRGHHAVTELGVAAYAGIPVVTVDGHVAGTLAVLDFKPRDWTDDMLAVLAHLAAIVIDEISPVGVR